MVAPAIQGIDLFKIVGRSISGWIPSFKTGTASHVRQPFCSQLEERLLLWLEYNPQVEWSYEAGETDVRVETLQVAAELLTLRRNTIRMIGGERK